MNAAVHTGRAGEMAGGVKDDLPNERAWGPAPAEDLPPNPVSVSVAARVMALHRWRKSYGKCVGQLIFALALEDGIYLQDPEEDHG